MLSFFYLFNLLPCAFLFKSAFLLASRLRASASSLLKQLAAASDVPLKEFLRPHLEELSPPMHQRRLLPIKVGMKHQRRLLPIKVGMKHQRRLLPIKVGMKQL